RTVAGAQREEAVLPRGNRPPRTAGGPHRGADGDRCGGVSADEDNGTRPSPEIKIAKGVNSHDVPSLPAREVEPPAWTVLVLLLHAGGARDVPVDEQVRPPRRGGLQRAHRAAVGADVGAARLAREARGGERV